MDRERPVITIPIGQNTRGFVQSGFYEVALMPAMLVPPCHATSQNPQDYPFVKFIVLATLLSCHPIVFILNSKTLPEIVCAGHWWSAEILQLVPARHA